MAANYPMLKAAIAAKRLDRVREIAREVGKITLADALRILLLVRDQDADKYEAAAVRWLGRFALEGHDVDIADLAHAVECVEMLRADAVTGMVHLQELCLDHGVG